MKQILLRTLRQLAQQIRPGKPAIRPDQTTETLFV